MSNYKIYHGDCLLYHGDCLELMKNIPDKSIDMILCDLPYGITKCKWDIVLPFESELTPKKIKELICEKIKSKRSYVNCVITVDRG